MPNYEAKLCKVVYSVNEPLARTGSITDSWTVESENQTNDMKLNN